MSDRYTTKDVERERDSYLREIKEGLSEDGLGGHLGLRQRCPCRRFIDDLAAHPNGTGKYCRKERLTGQVSYVKNSISFKKI